MSEFEGQNEISPEDLKRDLEENLKEVEENPDDSAFPVEVFPTSIQRIIRETNSALDHPQEFTGSALLFAASVAIGNSFRVKIKESYTPKANLYIALIGPPGSNKTHPLTFAIDPLIEADKADFKKYQEELEKYQKAKAKKKEERDQKEQEIAEGEEPTPQKRILNDATLEAIQLHHGKNERGLGLFVDELTGLMENFSRYSKGSDQQFYLSAWSGSPIFRDRAGSRSVYIPEPFISIAGTIQTRMLDRLEADRRGENGFMDRFLLILKKDQEKPLPSEKDLPLEIRENWEKIMGELLKMQPLRDENGFIRPRTLDFSKEARKRMQEWMKDLIQRRNNLENEAEQALMDKYEQHFARLALNLQLLKYATEEEEMEKISLNTVERVIKLTEYYLGQAFRVREILDEKQDPLAQLSEKWKAFFEALPQDFETHQAIETGRRHGIAERTVHKFLRGQVGKLFRKKEHGIYMKAI